MSDSTNVVAGGWSKFAYTTDEEKRLLGKEIKPGEVHLVPLLVTKQVVNGLNFVFAANDGVQAVQGNRPFPVIARAYAAPGESPVITQLHELGHPGAVGGYAQFQEITPEADATLKEAFCGHLGLKFEALLVSAQLVSGNNYLFAGNASSVTKDPQVYPAFVTVYKPLQGKARITSIKRAWEM